MARPIRGYKLADGSKVPGVTTITGRFKDSGGLLHWAWKQGMDGLDYRHTRDAAATAGTACHTLIDCHLRNHPEELPAELDAELEAKARKGFAAFSEWYSQTMVTIDVTETPMVSERYRFGGTPDAIGKVNGKRVLLDWKAANGIYSDYLCQCAAYVLLWEEHHPDDPIESVHLLRVGKEFSEFHHHQWGREVIDHAAKAFLHMRELYELDQLLKRAAA
jgi:Thiamine monophosphate kinase